MSLKEENLIAVDNIVKAGQRLQKIGNTFMPIGIGGNFEPGATIIKEVGRDTFYKCVSVSDNTWTGNILILGEDGFYTVSEEVTTGLTYGIGYTPKVGKIYNADATIEVGKYNKLITIPELGLVFYSSFANSNTAETGQTYDKRGSGHRFETIEGIPCYNRAEGESHQIYIDNSSVQFPTNGKPYTVCAWARVTTNTTHPLWYIGRGENPRETILWLDSNLSVNHYSEGYAIIEGMQRNKWYFWCETFDGTTCQGYGKRIDDTELITASRNVNLQIPDDFYFYFGGIRGGTNWMSEGAISSARVYNRVLTIDEITSLSQEFTA